MKILSRFSFETWSHAYRLLNLLFIATCLSLMSCAAIHNPQKRLKVEGKTMEPTILEGSDILITEKVGALERGDIVVFWFPDDPSKSLIKRIVAIGGEMIDMNKDGQITINGVALEEAYVLPDRNQMARARWAMVRSDWKVVKPHYYFLMGDNRDISNDSRSWGLVPEKYIWGKVVEPR